MRDKTIGLVIGIGGCVLIVVSIIMQLGMILVKNNFTPRIAKTDVASANDGHTYVMAVRYVEAMNDIDQVGGIVHSHSCPCHRGFWSRLFKKEMD